MTDPKRRAGYEKAYRQYKINRMAQEIDKMLYEILMQATHAGWCTFALDIGVNPPSNTTVKQLLSRYHRRASRRLKKVA